MRTRDGASTRLLVALCFATFLALGLPEGALGVAWPSIRDDFDRRLADLGILLAVYSVAYLGGSLAAGPLATRLGVRRILAGAALTAATGAVLFASAVSFVWLAAACVVLGAAGGAVDTGVNAYLALNASLRALGFAHAFYGVGATIGPFAIAGLLAGGASWRPAYVGIAVVQVTLGIAFLVRGGAGRAPTAGAVAASAPADRGPARRGAAFGVAMFFVYVGVEATAGQWAFSLLTEGRGESASVAGVLTGLYWGGLAVGRFVVAFAAGRLDPGRLLDVCLGGAGLGFLLLWLGSGPVVAGAGLILSGVSLAFVFPTLVSLTPSRVGPARATAVVGYQVAAAAAGGAVIPAAAGVLFTATDLEALGPVLLVWTAVLFLLHRLAAR